MDVEMKENLVLLQSFERDQAESLTPTIESTKNSLIQMVLNKIKLDSMKHAHIIQAIMDLDADQVIWYIDKQVMLEKIKRHLEIEQKMLGSIQKLIAEVKEEKVKPLLQEILEDEKRHHRMLTRLSEIVESIDVSKEDWLDLYRKRLQEEWPDF